MGIFLLFDTGKFPTNDDAVRQAISYFINRPAAIETALQGTPPALTTPLQPGVLGYSTNVPQYSFDPAKGNQLLTADGWKKVGGVWTKGGKQLSIVLNSLATDRHRADPAGGTGQSWPARGSRPPSSTTRSLRGTSTHQGHHDSVTFSEP